MEIPCILCVLFVVVQLLCLTLCDSTDCSTPGGSVLHHLLEFAQARVHRVGDRVVMPSSHLVLCCPLLLLPSFFPSIKVLANESDLRIRWQSTGASASASVLPTNIQGWFPLGLTDLISLQSIGLSRVFSSTTVWKHQFFGAQQFLLSSSHIHAWLLRKP